MARAHATEGTPHERSGCRFASRDPRSIRPTSFAACHERRTLASGRGRGPSTSRYLTRVHDAESLEDLRRGGRAGSSSSPEMTTCTPPGARSADGTTSPFRSALHRPRPLGMPPTATRSPSLLLFPPPRASTPPSFDPSSQRGPTTLRPRRIRPVSPSRRRCERRSVHPPRPATRRSRSTPRRERPSRRRSPPPGPSRGLSSKTPAPCASGTSRREG